MEVRAVNKYTGISAQKVRLVINELRGRPALEALALLQFMPQQSARQVAKTLKSAIANATENFGLEEEDLYIREIYADEAPRRRWRRFGARGRFKPWIRRSSHITVVLDERE
ncbi:MAG: 50S ribosomal protein L22 [Caldilineae bacterium]|nr:MAG: 50S ribosomal protein L22 [Caldilineae bacterium]